MQFTMEEKNYFDLLLVARATFLTTQEKIKWFSLLKQNLGYNFTIADFRAFTNRRITSPWWNPQLARQEAYREGELLKRQGYFVLSIFDKAYPNQLAQIFDPPFLLYCKGEVSALASLLIGVVGTRHPTSVGAKKAWEISYQLGELEARVVSGLALGIDSYAHAGNHKAKMGSVAILGCGIDTIYPAANKDLARELLKNGGVIISEYGLGVTPAPYRFPKRNRIVSGLTPLLIVVQAPKKSGALITADFSLQEGRDVMVVEGTMEGSEGFGSKELANSGAFVIQNKQQLVEIIKSYDYISVKCDSTSNIGKTYGNKKNLNHC